MVVFEMTKEGNAWPLVTLIAVLLLGAVAIVSITHSNSYGSTAPPQGNTTTTNHAITVTATGYARGQPSQAQMYINVNGTGSTTQNAVANLSSTMGNLNNTIYAYVGDNLSNIETSSYNVEAICNGTYYTISSTLYPRFKCSYPVTYEADERLIALLPNQTQAGAAVNALSAIPNVYVSSIYSKFSNAQIAALRPIALSDAMQNATEQASATLGSGYNISVLNVSVNSYYFRPFPLYVASTASSSPPPPIIYGGTSTISESVTAVFAYSKS